MEEFVDLHKQVHTNLEANIKVSLMLITASFILMLVLTIIGPSSYVEQVEGTED